MGEEPDELMSFIGVGLRGDVDGVDGDDDTAGCGTGGFTGEDDGITGGTARDVVGSGDCGVLGMDGSAVDAGGSPGSTRK